MQVGEAVAEGAATAAVGAAIAAAFPPAAFAIGAVELAKILYDCNQVNKAKTKTERKLLIKQKVIEHMTSAGLG